MTPPDAEDLFSRALELPPEERQTFLGQQCGTDTRLRAELESLLRWHELADAGSWEIPAEPDVLAQPALAHIRAPTIKRVGPFELQSLLGEGATGVVYRALDTRNGRSVPVKIASPKTMLVPADRERFQRAADAAMRIDHPHIARVLETGSVEGLLFVVLEYVEGQTLAERLKAGAFDRATAMRMALDVAHRHGIIHRDLKPANIMLGPTGVKILDFCLCHAFDGAESIGRTESGIALGTLGYMAPEQARGGKPTPQSDLFSFGAVLYEIVAGRRTFRGGTAVAILFSILHDQPEPGIERSRLMDLAFWCLEKNPPRRPANATRVLAELDRMERGGATIALRARRLPKTIWKVLAASVIGLIGALVIASLMSPGRHRQTGSGNWVQLTSFPDSVSQPALSPDGRRLAFIRSPSTWADVGQVYVKNLPDGEALMLTRDESRKMSPVFTPDASQIAYSTVLQNVWDTWLVRCSGGGDPQRWLSNAACPTWFGPHRLIFSEILDKDVHMAIVISDDTRSDSRRVYVPRDARAMAHRSYVSPDGRRVLVVEMDSAGQMLPRRLVPIDGTSVGRPVGPPAAGCTAAGWSRDGKWMYFSSAVGGLFHTWRQQFPDGEPEQITAGPTEEEGIAMAPDAHSFITAVGLRESSLWLRDSGGERQVSGDGFGFDPKITRNGKWLCYRILKGSNAYANPSELVALELDSGHTHHPLAGFSLVGGPGVAYDLSPDGTWVIAGVSVEGKPRLALAPVDAHAEPSLVPGVEGSAPLFENGDSILLHAGAQPGYLSRVRLDGTGLQRIGQEPSLVRGGPSPDRRWLPLRIVRQGGYANVLASLDGRPPTELAPPGALDYWLRWTPDANRISFSVTTGQFVERGRTYIVPLAHGRMLPTIPASGFRWESELAALPGAKRIDSWDIALGPGELMAFSRETLIRNLFRVPIP